MSDEIQELIQIENLLNQYSGKRYHLKSIEPLLTSLVEVEKIGHEKILTDDLTHEQMLVFIKNHLKVSLELDDKK